MAQRWFLSFALLFVLLLPLKSAFSQTDGNVIDDTVSVPLHGDQVSRSTDPVTLPAATFQPGFFEIWNMPVIAYSDALKVAQAGQVKALVLDQSAPIRAIMLTTKGERYKFYLPGTVQLARFVNSGTSIRIAGSWQLDGLINTLTRILMLLVLLGLFGFFLVYLRRNGFRRIKRFRPEKSRRVTFDDIAGQEDAKERLLEMVAFLKNPTELMAMDGRAPKGVLLVGDPGNGKTLLARALAYEAGVPFFNFAGADFSQIFVGQGAKLMKQAFTAARAAAPCIMFFDEIETVGGKRGASVGSDGTRERDQTQTQFLVEVDGVDELRGVILIGATNRPDMLDSAFTRPGRFDRRVEVTSPNYESRLRILRRATRNTPLAEDVDLEEVGRGCIGMSGASTANVPNEAIILSLREPKVNGVRREVKMWHLVAARDRIAMGPEQRGIVISEDEKNTLAVHEAGHVIVGLYGEDADPIERATILPRGGALGFVLRIPLTERYTLSLSHFEARMAMAMGGREAERLVFGNRAITNGASGDIKMVTEMARAMVEQFGMDEMVGPILVSRSMGTDNWPSIAMADLVDARVKLLTGQAAATASSLLREHIKALDIITQALLSRETLTGTEISDLLEDYDRSLKRSAIVYETQALSMVSSQPRPT